MAELPGLNIPITADTKGLKDAEKDVQGFGNGVANALGNMAIAAGVAAVALKGIEFNKMAETAKIAFTVMTGSAETAEKTLKDLKDYANKTPMEFKDVRQATQTLVQFGMGAEEAVATVKQLGDVSGGDAQKLQSLAVAMGQISSTGRLMGQDLLQLINAGFNPLMEISKQTGRSMADLKKDMEKGAISADMVKESFARATAEGGQFFGMLDKQAGTVTGKLSTMNDALETAAGSLMESFTPVIKLLADVVTGLANGFTQLPEGVQAFAGALMLAAGAAAALAGAAGILGISLAPLAPFIGVIAGVAAGIAAVVGIFAEVDKHNTERLNKEYGELAEKLGVTADEAERLHHIAKQIGVDAVEVRKMEIEAGKMAEAFGLGADMVDDIANSIAKQAGTTRNLSSEVDRIAKYYGTTREAVLAIAGSSYQVTAEQRKQLVYMRQQYEIEELRATRGGSRIAAEKALSDLRQKQLAEEKAVNDAEEKAAFEKRQKERDTLRESLSDWNMTERQKLDAQYAKDRAIVMSMSNATEQLKILDRKYQEDKKKLANEELVSLTELQDEKRRIAESDNVLQLAIVNDELKNIDITTQAQLDAYNEEVNSLAIAEDEKQRLRDLGTENYKQNLDDEKKANEKNFELILSATTNFLSNMSGLFQAVAQARMAEIDRETEAEIERLGLAEDTREEALQKEIDEAIAAGDTITADKKKQELERAKIEAEAEKKKAKVKYDADMASWAVSLAMGAANGALAVIKALADGGPFAGPILAGITGAAVAVQMAAIAASKPQPPKLWTGTTNPIAQAGNYIVGDSTGGGLEMVLPKGATVLNNRETTDLLGGGNNGAMRATIQMIMDGRMIAENTVDLINNGLVRLEVGA